MMMILARNLLGQSTASIAPNDSVEAILRYIKQHIYQPDFLPSSIWLRFFTIHLPISAFSSKDILASH
jgi:hypothetical protein